MAGNEEYAVFARRLVIARDRLGLTNKYVARKIGVHASQVGRWAKGECLPKADKMRLLADVLAVAVDWLLGRDVEKDTSDAERELIFLRRHLAPAKQRQVDEYALLLFRSGRDGQPGAQNVYLAHHDRWALAQVS